MAQTAHSLDPVKPGASLMSIDPQVNWHRYPLPITAAMTTPAYVPVISYSGGAYGDDIDTATATFAYNAAMGEASTYGPKTQAEKAAAMGTTLAVDVTSPRGYIEPQESYGAPPVSPADDPTITSLAPNTAVAGVTPTWVKITGTKFTQWSQVETGNVITPYSKYISPTRIDVLMDPRSSAGTVVVKVIDHGVKSAGSNFTFT